MNDVTTQTVDIDLKDLLCYILKHIIVIVVIAIVFACAGAGYSFYKQSNAAPASNVLNTSVKLPGESDEAYNNRIANVERANDIKENISVLTEQVAIQNDYINNSVYMQIDPLNVAITKAQVVISCGNDNVGGLETLYNAYMEDITRGEYIEEVADSLNCSVGAAQELITVDFESSDLTNTDSPSQMGIMNIRVIGVNVEDSDLIMDAIIAEVELKSAEFNTSIVSHMVTVVGRQNSVGYDAIVRQKQLDSVTVLNNIQSQINNLNNNLDNIAKMLGLADRMSFYEPVNNASTSGISVTSLLKYGIVGLFLGFVLSAGIYYVKYLFGQTIESQAQFFNMFRIANVGICKPTKNRNKLTALLDRWSNDDNSLDESGSNALISANYSNLTAGMKKILVTGTIESDAVIQRLNSLKLTGDVKLDIFSNPDVLKSVSEYDGIVFVEQRGISSRKQIKEQIRLINNSGVKIVGAIIL